MKRIIILMFLIISGSTFAGNLRLTFPNGGEKFLVGSDIKITWEGVAPNDLVKIEYRTDDNKPWITITESAVGLSYPFRIPKTVSKKYLVRITPGISNNGIEICDQKWMSKNLNVDSYRNGDPIRHAKTEAEWINAKKNKEGAWCYYNNYPANGQIYGKIYNWFAVNDPRGLAPYGWHVPTVEELDELKNCLGGESVAGGKLKSTGTIEAKNGLWSSPNRGATNESLFAAHPGGIRNYEGKFYYLGMQGFWWASTEYGHLSARGMSLEFNSPNYLESWIGEEAGCSVRCIREMQSDTSDAYWEVGLQTAASHDVDMKQCLVGTDRDSLVTDFVQNKGSWEFRVDSIYFTGADASAFSLVSGLPVYTVAAGASKATKFRFKPTEARKYEADIVIITQVGTLKQKIYGEGVQPLLKIMNHVIDFGKVEVGTPKDSVQAFTIENIGSAPLTITSTNHAAPDAVSFSTVSGGGNFTIPAGEAHTMHLRFIPSSTDITKGILQFHYNGGDSPAEIILSGQGVHPEIVVVQSELDFGRILLGRDTTLRQAITIANIGNEELKITDVKITNPEFTRLSGLTAFDLLPGDTLKYDLKFTPSHVGPAAADLEIYHNEANSPTKVKMIGEGIAPKIEVVNSEIDFGKVLLGSDSTIHKAITIANTGTAKLKITDVKINNSEFERVSGLTAFDLLAGDTLKYDLKFTPSQLAPVTADLEIYHNQANSPTKVKLIGEGYEFVGTASATLQALNISANAGEIIELPIILKNQSNLEVAKITSLKVDVGFNPTLLYPLDYPIQTIDQNTAKLTIENIPTNIAIGQPLIKVKFKAALGNAEKCDLALSNAEAVGGNAEINYLPGQFSLLGVCHEGGTRLVNPNANIGIRSITPNPAKDKITIKAKITEIGTKIKLIDITGKVIKEIDCIVDKAKVQEFTIDLTNVPAGMYFIEFKSPNFSQVEKVVVEK